MADPIEDTNTGENTSEIDNPSTQGELSNEALDGAQGAADDLRTFQTEMIKIQTQVSISNSSFQSMVAILDKASQSSIR